MKSFAKNYQEEIKVGAVAAAVAFFFTHGLPLWNEDYSIYMAQANGSFFELIARLLLPFSIEPQTWGYSDHPVQVLLYKVFSVIFGTWGTGFFFMKSLVLGGLCGAMYHRMRKLGADRFVAISSLVIFGLSANVIATMVWHSDFTVYAQLVLALILFYAVPQIEKGPANKGVYKKGITNLPKNFSRFLITFFLAVYFGSKLGADVRLAPVVLLTYLYLYRREKFDVYLAPFAATFVLTLPFSSAFFRHLPPFFPGASGYSGMTYSTFGVTRVFEFLMKDMFSLQSAPLSLLGALGLFTTLAAVAYGGYRVYRDKYDEPSEKTGFLLIWAGWALLASGIVTRSDPSMDLRYTVMIMVPATLLLSIFFQMAMKEFNRVKWMKPAIIALVVVQSLVHVYQSTHHRAAMGHTMVAVDKIYSTMEQKYASAQMLLLPGFLNYGYKNTSASSVAGRKAALNDDDVYKMPAGQTYAATWVPTLAVHYSVAEFASGCGSSLFDLIVQCRPTDGALLLKYVGSPPEANQAQQLSSQGNNVAARDVLYGYLKKDPTNQGVMFLAGLYAYYAKDFAGMEQVYDQIGPYFMGHPSVVYNWALAKQGLQKTKEATRYFETAYRIMPKDYSIGFNLADSYYREGKKSRALATLGELLQVNPNDQTMKSVYADWSKN